MRDGEPDRTADERAQDAGNGRLAKTGFEEHDQRRQGERETDVREDTDRNRLKDCRRVRDRGHEENTRERKPGHGSDPRFGPAAISMKKR